MQTESRVVQTEDRVIPAISRIMQAESRVVHAEGRVVQTESRVVHTEGRIIPAISRIIDPDRKDRPCFNILNLFIIVYPFRKINKPAGFLAKPHRLCSSALRALRRAERQSMRRGSSCGTSIRFFEFPK